jgi:hypothetical protein
MVERHDGHIIELAAAVAEILDRLCRMEAVAVFFVDGIAYVPERRQPSRFNRYGLKIPSWCSQSAL